MVTDIYAEKPCIKTILDIFKYIKQQPPLYIGGEVRFLTKSDALKTLWADTIIVTKWAILLYHYR